MKNFNEFINEAYTPKSGIITVYKASDKKFNKIDTKFMVIADQGVGTYFTDYEFAKTNASFKENFLLSTEINLKYFVDSWIKIEKLVSLKKLQNFLFELYKTNEEGFFNLSLYFGIEVLNPEDLTEFHVLELSELIKSEQIRNFQKMIAEEFGIETFVKLWNKYFSEIHGTIYDENDVVYYSIINTKLKVKEEN